MTTPSDIARFVVEEHLPAWRRLGYPADQIPASLEASIDYRFPGCSALTLARGLDIAAELLRADEAFRRSGRSAG
ncbi:Putative RNA polymerase ECF-subfamily sigma factor (fragment) [Mesorhizobium plurifarium]|uniref:Putative RNA polymerase ECF-subfamily sigma factor n=1 Tax=Mesorhizobium plurifarium TaxID=69974 RepID=A0A090FT55_MESPL